MGENLSAQHIFYQAPRNIPWYARHCPESGWAHHGWKGYEGSLPWPFGSWLLAKLGLGGYLFSKAFLFFPMGFFFSQTLFTFFKGSLSLNFVTDQNELLMAHSDLFHMLSIICTIKILTVALMAWAMGRPMWKVQCVGEKFLIPKNGPHKASVVLCVERLPLHVLHDAFFQRYWLNWKI